MIPKSFFVKINSEEHAKAVLHWAINNGRNWYNPASPPDLKTVGYLAFDNEIITCGSNPPRNDSQRELTLNDLYSKPKEFSFILDEINIGVKKTDDEILVFVHNFVFDAKELVEKIQEAIKKID